MHQTPAKHRSDYGKEIARVQTVDDLLESSSPHQRAIVATLALANRFDLNCVHMLMSLADELPTRPSIGTRYLAQQIEQGCEVLEAINNVPGLLSPTTVLAFRMANDAGELSELYSTFLDRRPACESASVARDEDLISKFFRLFAKVFVIGIVMSFIMLKIAPEFMMMLQEFGIESPAVFELWITICDVIARYWFVGALLMLIVMPLSVPAFRQFLRRFNPLTWRQPIPTAAANRRRTLAMMVQSGKSIAATIPTLLATDSLRSLFRRLGRVSETIDKGENEWNSLASQRIISAREAKALALTNDAPTQAWLLRWAAGNRQNRRQTRVAFLSRFFVGLVNFGIGLFVLLAAVAVLMTLITIMKSLG